MYENLRASPLDDLSLTSKDLDYAPDINLLLNDYLWIGRFVRHRLISEEFARATYGRSLLILYPKLKPYIVIEREQRREFPTLWNDVDWLYKRFKQFYSQELKPHVVQREMERWMNPATRLTTGHPVDVVGLVTGKQVLTRFEFEGRDGNIYCAHYYRFPRAVLESM